MSNQYRDEIAKVCHNAMKAAHSVGGISDSELKEFEADCFEEKESKTASVIEKSSSKEYVSA
jgi:DNA-binding transcriptional regulator YiaG